MNNYKISQRSACLHCQTTVKWENPYEKTDNNGRLIVGSPQWQLFVYYAMCPECFNFIATLEMHKKADGSEPARLAAEQVVWPLLGNRPPAPKEVPPAIAQDYQEATLVLTLSPKASAALSRRCLQNLLTDRGFMERDLFKQIDQAIPTLPGWIADNLDVVRVVGNLAAHPSKSKITGEIVDVEPGEAEWNLDVLDSLFNYYYVRPEQERKKREALNQKLTEIGKSPLP
jgi:hypothetical protein